MNAKIKTGIAFLAGFISGAAGMFVFVKTKWQKDFETKRNEMIRYYENKEPAIEEPLGKEVTIDKENEDLNEAKSIIRKFNYSKISTPEENTKNTSPILNEEYYDETPYEIDSRDFGGQEMYDMATLYLYEDGKVMTADYRIMDDADVENHLGRALLQKIADMRDADPEFSTFYARNDRLRTDYEIIIKSGVFDT